MFHTLLYIINNFINEQHFHKFFYLGDPKSETIRYNTIVEKGNLENLVEDVTVGGVTNSNGRRSDFMLFFRKIKFILIDRMILLCSYF